MGWKHISTLKIPTTSELKERVGITNNYDFVRSDLDGNITNSGKGSRGQIMKPPRQESTNVMFEQKTMNGQNKTMTTL